MLERLARTGSTVEGSGIGTADGFSTSIWLINALDVINVRKQ
jgi:hypothetical protein